MFLIFIIFSIFGSLFEQIQYLIKHYISTSELIWPSRTAVIYGQFNMIYGFGAVIFILLLNRKNIKWYRVFIEGSIIGGTFEYIMSLLLEIFVGTKSWDYSKKFLNINGRTTIPIMMMWGFLSVILIKLIYPKLSYLIDKIPKGIGMSLVDILLIFIIFDMVISWSALIRQNLRRKEIKPYTPVGKFYDKFYTDEYLKEVYPNMVSK